MNIDLMKLAQAITTLAAAGAVVIAAYSHFEKRRTAIITEVELRSEILDTDIKKDAETRAYYKDLSDDRALSPAESSRLEYLEEQLSRKYEQQKRLQAKADELEMK
jgi:hypothetical protein